MSDRNTGDAQNSLLRIVNDVAGALLACDVESFDATLLQCLEKIGSGVNVDRVYLWKNHMQGEELYTSQICEWSGGADPQQGTELTVSVPFPDAWYPDLSADRCVNGMVRTFEGYERAHLEAQGIVSIIVVPVFLHGEFWGFTGFDDCRTERVFNEGEEAILRSVSLLFATAMLRNEMTLNLITAREEALFNAKVKTDFLANMSHEIRTPINAIMGMSRVARMADDKQRVIECLDSIDMASYELLSLVNDIIDMSKAEAGNMRLVETPFRVKGLFYALESMISGRVAEKRQTFTMELGDNLPETLIGDDVRITQALLNVLYNAVKFTPDGGAIRLAVASSSPSDGCVELAVAVSDTGIGIASSEIERLFFTFEQLDMSVTRRFSGTGLGLAIAKSIVDLMDGGIDVESVLGKGSTFTVRVRLRECDVAECAASADDDTQDFAMPSFTGKRALLVEDVPMNREVVMALLEPTELAIDIAEDGQKGLDMFAASPEKYDIIFMDIQMPVMDGYAATRAIRCLPTPKAEEVPILALTANVLPEDVDRCFEAGMNGHIGKPVELEVLLDMIAEHFLLSGMHKRGAAI